MNQAKAFPVREARSIRSLRSVPRAPLFAVLLSLSVLLAPDLTVAPARVDRGPDPRPSVVAEQVLAGGPPAGSIDAPLYPPALEAALLTSGASGVEFAVVHDGLISWAGAAGHELAGNMLSASRPMVIGSVSKTFVAADILSLVEEGRLSLDSTLGELLPPHRAVSPDITVEQLLDHRSGVADLFNKATVGGIESSPDRVWTRDEVLATLGNPSNAPGAGWSYANTNFFLLGMVAERVDGRPLEAQLSERFLVPLGLTSTRMLTVDDPAPLTAAWATIFWGSGAMVSSAADLARWGDALYGGRLLEPATMARMLDFGAEDYGLGTQRLTLGSEVGVGHTGLLDTYTTLLFHLPDGGPTLALVVNSPHAPLSAMVNAAAAGGGPSLLELATTDR